MDEIYVGDIVQTRKAHPCGNDRWRVIRVGADVKIRCLGCDRIVMMERADFVKRRKKTIERGDPAATAQSPLGIFDGKRNDGELQ